MAQGGLQWASCSICLDVLKDPVTTSCGHSFCMSCINRHWDQQNLYSCPQCRQVFSPRPVLVRNTVLADLVEQLQKSVLTASPADHHQAGPGSRRDLLIQTIQDRESDLQRLPQEAEALRSSAQETLERSRDRFIQVARLLEKRWSEVEQQIQSELETEETQLQQLHYKLQQDISELRTTLVQMDSLSHTQDFSLFLQTYLFQPKATEALDRPRVHTRPGSCFQKVMTTVSEFTDQIQIILNHSLHNVSLTKVQKILSEPEPSSREDLLRFSTEVTLDPNTVNTDLFLTKKDRSVSRLSTMGWSTEWSNPDHLDRFSYWSQVLSRESLTGRCYWEVETCMLRDGSCVRVAVAYKTIQRKGSSNECGFGANDKSWALHCDKTSYNFWFNNVRTPVSGPTEKITGVYLDHDAGVLSFYSVQGETVRLLHRVQTRFTQPLFAGVNLGSDTIATFNKLR